MRDDFRAVPNTKPRANGPIGNPEDYKTQIKEAPAWDRSLVRRILFVRLVQGRGVGSSILASLRGRWERPERTGKRAPSPSLADS
jgi:hypothetical protein